MGVRVRVAAEIATMLRLGDLIWVTVGDSRLTTMIEEIVGINHDAAELRLGMVADVPTHDVVVRVPAAWQECCAEHDAAYPRPIVVPERLRAVPPLDPSLSTYRQLGGSRYTETHALDDGTVATLLDLARANAEADFRDLARMSGVPAKDLDALWAGTRRRVAPE